MTASDLLVRPAYFTHPDYSRTLGGEVGELSALAGFPPDPEQQLLLDATFAMDHRGMHAAFEVCIICARQNMKTGFFKQVALGKAFILDRKLMVWSAHEFSTAQEAFRDLTELIENCPSLDRRVKRISRGNGDEEIELLGGARIKFKARTKTGGRGLSGEDVFLDEGFALQPTHMGALLPTLSAQPDPQVLYGSSAGLDTSAVLRGIRDRGRAGDGRLVYMEFCAPTGGCETESCHHELEAVGCALDNRENLRAANPQAGRRISWQYLTDERRALAPSEYARERLGWWDEPVEDAAGDIDLDLWGRLANPGAPPPDGPAALAIDIPPDRSMTSMAVAWRAESGRLGVMVTALKGTSTAVQWVKNLSDGRDLLSISLHAGGPAGSLVAELAAVGVDVTAVTTQAMAQATGAMVDLVSNFGIEHLDQPELNAAVAAGRLKNTGDAQYWDRRDLTDISPLVAVTLAAHGFTANEPDDYDVLQSVF